MAQAKEFYRALAPLGIRWISQASINAAHDEEFLDLIARSGCQGVLIGFESLNRDTLKAMGKGFNQMGGGFEPAMANLRRHGLRVYGTFVFGYDNDTEQSFDAAVEFALHHKMFIAAFNHLTPFPGTPHYEDLKRLGRLLSETWWLDADYRYNNIAFQPQNFTPAELQAHCIAARRRFYAPRNILRRGYDRVNCATATSTALFMTSNLMIGREVPQRDLLPLGEAAWTGGILQRESAAAARAHAG